MSGEHIDEAISATKGVTVKTNHLKTNSAQTYKGKWAQHYGLNKLMGGERLARDERYKLKTVCSDHFIE